MSTHMWTNGATRRSQRISLDLANQFPPPNVYNLHESDLFNPFISNAVAFQQKVSFYNDFL